MNAQDALPDDSKFLIDQVTAEYGTLGRLVGLVYLRVSHDHENRLQRLENMVRTVLTIVTLVPIVAAAIAIIQFFGG